MTHETPAAVADLAGVMTEVARLEAVAATLDARLDSSLRVEPDRGLSSAGAVGPAVIDLRQRTDA